MNKVEKLNVPIAKTSLLLSEIESVLEPLKSGWLVQGKHVAAFEKKWSHFTGAQRSIAVTLYVRLHLSAVALGLKPGDGMVPHLLGSHLICGGTSGAKQSFDINLIRSILIPQKLKN